MPFEVFDSKSAGATKNPMVTIQKDGPFSLNRAAYELIGSPEAVELLFDRENQLIGFRPTASDNPRAFVPRPQGPNASTVMIAGRRFAQHYELDVSKARRYPVEKRDDILILDLSADSVVVTGPRTGMKGRTGAS